MRLRPSTCCCKASMRMFCVVSADSKSSTRMPSSTKPPSSGISAGNGAAPTEPRAPLACLCAGCCVLPSPTRVRIPTTIPGAA